MDSIVFWVVMVCELFGIVDNYCDVWYVCYWLNLKWLIYGWRMGMIGVMCVLYCFYCWVLLYSGLLICVVFVVDILCVWVVLLKFWSLDDQGMLIKLYKVCVVVLKLWISVL